MKQVLQLRVSQHLALTPQLQQSIRLLQLSTLELNQEIEVALDQLRTHLKAPADNLTQDIYVEGGLPTGRIMAKDEDVCLHCGLCAERCPTGAWDMQKYLIDITQAGPACRTR